jgi:hypothetical protein
LSLSIQSTQQKSELVFKLTEKSEGIEFSQEVFTIASLEQEFQHTLKARL